MPSLKLSNPFRPDPEKPTLRERGAALRAGLARLTRRPEPEASADQGRRAVMGGVLAAAVPLPVTAAASGEYAEYRSRLLATYAETVKSWPVSSIAPANSIEGRAATLVQHRCWAIASEAEALLPARTLEGLAVVALAAAVLHEADPPSCSCERSVVTLIRAALAVTSTALPRGFVGFGDEPDYRQRSKDRGNCTGSLPAWAIAEAEAEAADA